MGGQTPAPGRKQPARLTGKQEFQELAKAGCVYTARPAHGPQGPLKLQPVPTALPAICPGIKQRGRRALSPPVQTPCPASCLTLDTKPCPHPRTAFWFPPTCWQCTVLGRAGGWAAQVGRGT